MNNRLLRFVSLLLIPCLLADSAAAAGVSFTPSAPAAASLSRQLFETEALATAAAWVDHAWHGIGPRVRRLVHLPEFADEKKENGFVLAGMVVSLGAALALSVGWAVPHSFFSPANPAAAAEQIAGRQRSLPQIQEWLKEKKVQELTTPDPISRAAALFDEYHNWKLSPQGVQMMAFWKNKDIWMPLEILEDFQTSQPNASETIVSYKKKEFIRFVFSVSGSHPDAVTTAFQAIEDPAFQVFVHPKEPSVYILTPDGLFVLTRSVMNQEVSFEPSRVFTLESAPVSSPARERDDLTLKIAKLPFMDLPTSWEEIIKTRPRREEIIFRLIPALLGNAAMQITFYWSLYFANIPMVNKAFLIASGLIVVSVALAQLFVTTSLFGWQHKEIVTDLVDGQAQVRRPTMAEYAEINRFALYAARPYAIVLLAEGVLALPFIANGFGLMAVTTMIASWMGLALWAFPHSLLLHRENNRWVWNQRVTGAGDGVLFNIIRGKVHSQRANTRQLLSAA